MTERSIPKIPLDAIKPAYFVVYQPSSPTQRNSSPIVNASQPKFEASGTLPHMMDRDFIPALPAIWFCLHLPATCFDFRDVQACHIKKLQGFDFSHEIILTPSDIFGDLFSGLQHPFLRPVLVIVDDECAESIRGEIAAGPWDLDTLTFSELSPEMLPHFWQRIAEMMNIRKVELPAPPAFCDRLDAGPLLLPIRTLRRQFPAEGELPNPTEEQHVEALLDYGLHLHSVVSAVAKLEDEGRTPSEAEKLMPEEIARQSAALSIPVAISLPGLPASYCKEHYPGHRPSELFKGWHAFEPTNTFEAVQQNPDDGRAERVAFQIATTHRACATTGLGISLDPVPANLFGAVTQLEEHFRARTQKSAYIWKTMREIGNGMANRLTPLQHAALARATQITAFTNFPLGWTILPGDSAPLMCRRPIAYRPVLPLTRTLQQELLSKDITYIGESVRILVAEALPKDDQIRHESFRGLEFLEAEFRDHPRIDVCLRETGNPESLRAAVRDYQPDILLLSCHGVYERRRGFAGVMIGNDICIGPELGPMPPFVILSACHVAPRGKGAVCVGELLMREGASAVLATQIPIHVHRNMSLMVRLFVYIEESISRREPHRTIGEVWHRTAALNAIHDIVQSNDVTWRWAHERRDGHLSPLEEFQLKRSVGRLRAGHVYEDSERVMREIGEEWGMPDEMEAVLRDRNYVPETLFYFMLGWPDRIRLNDPLIQQYSNRT